LAAIIRGQIERGELASRSPVPSESYLQQRYRASRGTARKAVEVLRSEGIVYTVPQRGTYVAEKTR
jgi:DNA-binding GntR family transcriptional regulator